jgi:atypical dual specificity phosphatase
MRRPSNFSWIDKPHLAALARPDDPEELAWLRRHGIEVLLSLTELPPTADWLEQSGLLLYHVPMIDMEAPSLEQLDLCISAIKNAHDQRFGVAIHCGAGLGRTGVVLACYFVHQGMEAHSAIARVRGLRPGSIETPEQAEVVVAFARKLARQAENR